MIRRIVPLVLLLFAVLPCARAQPDTSQAERYVRRYAAHYRVPPELIAALIDVESRWNPRAVSDKGAMGLMQLMPATARRYGAIHPFEVEENIAAGTRYVTALMWEFHGDMRLVSAAYYAGDRWIAKKAIELQQPGCRGLRRGRPAEIHDAQTRIDRCAKEVGAMRHFEVFLAMMLLPLPALAADHAVPARVATLTIDPREVTILHLRPEFESSIRMPEEVTSVILGSPGAFKAEHNEGEPQYVYVKPITKEPAQSNLLIATKSGQHVTIELISAGASAASDTPPVDFLIEYRTTRSFLVAGDTPGPIAQKTTDKGQERKTNSRAAERSSGAGDAPRSAIDEVFAQQAQINAPEWTKWEGRQIETSVGGVRQWKNETVVAYSIFNNSDASVEIVPPQIQIAGRKPDKKKSKKSKGILSDQMEIRDYKLSTTRLEPGARADGVVVFDRPNFKESTEQLFLQIAQADQVDRPILIRLPFTPPISSDNQ